MYSEEKFLSFLMAISSMYLMSRKQGMAIMCAGIQRDFKEIDIVARKDVLTGDVLGYELEFGSTPIACINMNCWNFQYSAYVQ